MSNLPAGARFEPGKGGLERLVIERAECSAEIYALGATITAWAPRRHEQVLFTSRAAEYREGKAIRGGVPICFPWFGPKPGMAAHGFARNTSWRWGEISEHHGAVKVVLHLEDDDQTRVLWPHRFAAKYTIEAGEKLTLTLEVTNKGEAPFVFESALHTYFAVKDVRQILVRGLENAPYLDRAGGQETPRQSEGGPFAITAETDRMYLGNISPIEIEDPGNQRRISIHKDGARTSVVWNPWIEKSKTFSDFEDDEWIEMLCVEPANARSDAIHVAPGASHRMKKLIVVNGSI